MRSTWWLMVASSVSGDGEGGSGLVEGLKNSSLPSVSRSSMCPDGTSCRTLKQSMLRNNISAAERSWALRLEIKQGNQF